MKQKDDDNGICWLSSKEMQQHLKITGCELMHSREKGQLVFEKRGNAFFYLLETNLQSTSDDD